MRQIREFSRGKNLNFTLKMSDYFVSLSSEDKLQYSAKLTLSDGSILPDPFTLELENEVSFLPDV